MKRWKYSVIGAAALLLALPAFAFGTDPSLFLVTWVLAFVAGLLMCGKWLGR
jgi:hypothetical protein